MSQNSSEKNIYETYICVYYDVSMAYYINLFVSSVMQFMPTNTGIQKYSLLKTLF